jgi:hypothetical protein
MRASRIPLTTTVWGLKKHQNSWDERIIKHEVRNCPLRPQIVVPSAAHVIAPETLGNWKPTAILSLNSSGSGVTGVLFRLQLQAAF